MGMENNAERISALMLGLSMEGNLSPELYVLRLARALDETFNINTSLNRLMELAPQGWAVVSCYVDNLLQEKCSFVDFNSQLIIRKNLKFPLN